MKGTTITTTFFSAQSLNVSSIVHGQNSHSVIKPAQGCFREGMVKNEPMEITCVPYNTEVVTETGCNEKSCKSIMYATIHRAAYKHYYGDNLGIRRPASVGNTKLCYMDEDGTGVFWGDWIDVGILPDIKIWGKDAGVYKETDRIFATIPTNWGI